MSIIDIIGKTVLQQHEGDQQLASALAQAARASTRHTGRFLGRTLRSAPSEHPLP
jgi:hypothetical protein